MRSRSTTGMRYGPLRVMASQSSKAVCKVLSGQKGAHSGAPPRNNIGCKLRVVVEGPTVERPSVVQRCVVIGAAVVKCGQIGVGLQLCVAAVLHIYIPGQVLLRVQAAVAFVRKLLDVSALVILPRCRGVVIVVDDRLFGSAAELAQA